MTVHYMQNVATDKNLAFLRLLFRWRGSLWKNVYEELRYWLMAHCVLQVIYRFGLHGNGGGAFFENLVERCAQLRPELTTLLSFAVGFYVTQVGSRWWQVFMMIPWPDNVAFEICAFVQARGAKFEETDRVIRRTMMRYLNMSYVLVMRDISERMRKRLPTLLHMVPDLMTKEEHDVIIEETDQRKLWIPIEWIMDMLQRLQDNKQISPVHYPQLVQTVLDYRDRLHNLYQSDSINLPLVYTQVVNVCTIFYFILRCIESQPLLNNIKTEADYITSGCSIPVVASFEFILLVGWVKVAQVMLNPFGMDDDDFDMDAIIQRNLEVSYAFVDNIFNRTPDLVDIKAGLLPHTAASVWDDMRMNPMMGSATQLEVPKKDQAIVDTEDVLRYHELKPTAAWLMSRASRRARSVDKEKEAVPAVPAQPANTPTPAPVEPAQPAVVAATTPPKQVQHDVKKEHVQPRPSCKGASRLHKESQEPLLSVQRVTSRASHLSGALPTPEASFRRQRLPTTSTENVAIAGAGAVAAIEPDLVDRLNKLEKVQRKRRKLIDEEADVRTQSVTPESSCRQPEDPRPSPNASAREHLQKSLPSVAPTPQSQVTPMGSVPPSVNLETAPNSANPSPAMKVHKHKTKKPQLTPMGSMPPSAALETAPNSANPSLALKMHKTKKPQPTPKGGSMPPSVALETAPSSANPSLARKVHKTKKPQPTPKGGSMPPSVALETAPSSANPSLARKVHKTASADPLTPSPMPLTTPLPSPTSRKSGDEKNKK